MIKVAFATKIIEKLMEYTSYNIAIMDEQGIIIASSDKRKIGSFHEIAYRIITQKIPQFEVSENDDYLGVRNGVNLALMYKNKIVGVLGVTGIPETVKSVALIIKMTVETLFEYEMSQETLARYLNLESYFINRLLYEEEVDKKELSGLAEQLGYKDDMIRVPILFKMDIQTVPEILLRKIKEGVLYSKQDIFAITKDKHIIIFKSIPKTGEKFFVTCKYLIEEYLDKLTKFVEKENCQCIFYVGSMQDNFSDCQMSYHHCVWLENNIDTNDSIVYFYNYVSTYLRGKIPVIETHGVFGLFEKLWTDNTAKNYAEIAGALLNNNYNLVLASKELYIHKNTLIFQLGKIKEELGINPLQNIKDRKFMNYLYYYFSDKK